ncbi:hypothetical protein BC937DRAFT_92274, partial [Endogone sp. FLAS-F59071]
MQKKASVSYVATWRAALADCAVPEDRQPAPEVVVRVVGNYDVFLRQAEGMDQRRLDGYTGITQVCRDRTKILRRLVAKCGQGEGLYREDGRCDVYHKVEVFSGAGVKLCVGSGKLTTECWVDIVLQHVRVCLHYNSRFRTIIGAIIPFYFSACSSLNSCRKREIRRHGDVYSLRTWILFPSLLCSP